MKKLKDYLTIVLGLIMVAFAVSVIIAPNKIVQGGVTGFSTVLFYVGNIPISVTNFVTNAILILLGIKILGREFIIKTVISTAILSLFIEIFSKFSPLVEDKLLASIFGGCIYGIGIGLTLLKGSSSGGTDIIGRIFQYFFPHMSIGTLLLCIDGAVILGSYIVFKDVELVLYGCITIFISTFSINYLIKKLNISKVAFVISAKGDLIAKKLISTSGRGVTKIDVVGAYSEDKKYMLMCAIKEKEMPEFQRKIEEIDEEAFTIFSESQQIFGNGFYVYK